jgi:hypothetical protein
MSLAKASMRIHYTPTVVAKWIYPLSGYAGGFAITKLVPSIH